jgi:hypothetical protein
MQRGTANLRSGDVNRPGAHSQRALSLFLLLFFFTCGLNLFAQEGVFPDDEFPAPEWDDIITVPYTRGDRNFIITMGILYPAYFGGDVENNNHGLTLGGNLSLTFNYFLNHAVFLGGELCFSFTGTRGGNMLYMVPFGARIGYQFMFRRFEFPFSLMIGAAAQSYLGMGYFGPIVKPGASAYWRFSPDWSFGLNSYWWFVPQWPHNGHDVYGNFMELTLSARYHF